MLPRLLPVIDALCAVRASVAKIKIIKELSSIVIDALCAVRVGGTALKIKSNTLPILHSAPYARMGVNFLVFFVTMADRLLKYFCRYAIMS